MGLFSGISRALFGDGGASEIRRASNEQLDFQQRGLDYAIGVNELPLEIRNQMLPMLSDFYSGGEGQNQLISDVQSSPFYNQMVQAGQEGVLSNAGAMGLSRSGNTAQDLSLSNQGVLQNLVNQRLQGMQGLAGMPINAGAVTGQYNQMGQNVGSAGMGIAQAGQSGMGSLFGLASGALGLAGGLGWKPFGD